MKEIKIPESIREDKNLADSVNRASKLLAAQAPPSGALTTAEWRLHFDVRQRPIIDLSLRDWIGDAATSFTPSDLANDRFMESRLIRLWGDLLQDRSHKQISQFAQPSTESEGS